VQCGCPTLIRIRTTDPWPRAKVADTIFALFEFDRAIPGASPLA
jgi:hypothetical protein